MEPIERDFQTILAELEACKKQNLKLREMDAQRTLAEQALRESEERYRTLYEASRRAEELYRSLLYSSADAVVIYDMRGNTQYVSHAFTEIFG